MNNLQKLQQEQAEYQAKVDSIQKELTKAAKFAKQAESIAANASLEKQQRDSDIASFNAVVKQLETEIVPQFQPIRDEIAVIDAQLNELQKQRNQLVVKHQSLEQTLNKQLQQAQQTYLDKHLVYKYQEIQTVSGDIVKQSPRDLTDYTIIPNAKNVHQQLKAKAGLR